MTPDAEHAAVLRHFLSDNDDPLLSPWEKVAPALKRSIDLLEREERRARDQYISDLYQ